MYNGYYSLHHSCSLLTTLSSGLGVEQNKFTFGVKKEEKKPSQEYHQPFFQCKCVPLRVEQLSIFGNSFPFFCLFFSLWGVIFLRKKDQLFNLRVVELPCLVCVSFCCYALTVWNGSKDSLLWPPCVTNKCRRMELIMILSTLILLCSSVIDFLFYFCLCFLIK